jgi:hypothetical protein
MGIRRYVANANNTIRNAYQSDLSTRGTGSNTGKADIVETYSLYGRQASSSVELSRILMKFPIASITSDRNDGIIPASGSVSFYLRLYNAPHSVTTPQDYSLVVEPLAKDWEEGLGTDLTTYKDLTNGNTGSNWIMRNSDDIREITRVTFTSDTKADYGAAGGANYIKMFNTATRFNMWFNDGSGDSAPSADGTEVEIDISSTSAASGNIASAFQTTVDALAAFDASYDSIGGANVYVTASIGGGATDASTVGTLNPIALSQSREGNNATPWDKVGGDYITTANAAYPWRWYSQTFATGLEDMEIDITGLVELWSAGTIDNYGVGIHLTGASEGYYAVDDDGTYSGYLENPTGSTISYYTKRFFGRGTQYYFMKPVIEARWDSTIKDDRGDTYYSSSLAPVNDNINTLYLYNYVRGVLRDIPGIDGSDSGDPIYVSFYSGSDDNSEPSGQAASSSAATRAAIELPQTLPRNWVTDKNPYVVTGAWVETGIYSASFAITGAAAPLTKIFDVWHNGAGKNNPWASVEYATSSFYPTNFSASVTIRKPVYHLNITNLRDKYRSDETARLNLFVRHKYWDPNVYTVANTSVESTTIQSASYRVFRLMDAYEAIPYGTGSDIPTGLSYDISGNYFDFDMSLLEPGYAYAFKFSFYDTSLKSWTEQRQTFKFRVEDYEY